MWICFWGSLTLLGILVGMQPQILRMWHENQCKLSLCPLFNGLKSVFIKQIIFIRDVSMKQSKLSD